MEVAEGRGRWLLLVIGLVAIWNATSVAYLGKLETWLMAMYMASLFFLLSAFASVVLALAPQDVRGLQPLRREQLVYAAAVLLAVALILIAIRGAYASFEANRGEGPFG